MKKTPLKINNVKNKLKKGKVCFGTMLRILKSPQSVALCASQGWDYIILDTEHNDYNLETLATFSIIAKYEDISLFVRVPDKLYHQMAQILDVGAEGLVIPQVKTVDEAERIIEATKYSPMGKRGVSISDIVTRYRGGDQESYTKWANDELLNIIQIESEEGVKNMENIFSTKGIDAVIIGPSDLTQDMGIPGQITHPKVEEIFRKVIEMGRKKGITPGIHLSDIDLTKKWMKEGMQLITYSYDSTLLNSASKQALSQLREV